ncbi:acetoacetyl-CoA reductase [Propionivibrio limicola]|uniref:acetoacetyl-CoA reductase n=1 Tax=Propionivibrio limicola TaxID=167645 RepID=UPI0012925CDA|nr:acetoacetyl-CoA reductase [Propionivibrio limicola]
MQKVALVTGGMGGIGQAVCGQLAMLGFKVVATHTPGNAKVSAWQDFMREKMGGGAGFTGFAIPCDVADYDSCRACVETVEREVGPVDVLVNNAGITRDMTFRRMTRADWDAVIDTNLGSVFNMTRQVIDGMVERKWGRVINVSSVNAQKGAFGQTNYAAAKAGMHGFTKALALEVARYGVTVNTVSPGYIETPMTSVIPTEIMTSKVLPQIPVGRLGSPDEIAALVAYLVSDAAAYMTGADLSINGGMHMS